MGRGMLTGEIKSPDDIPDGDMRKTMPRFLPENFSKNLDLVKELENLANQKGVTPAQLSLAWLRAISKKDSNPEIIPIPGATTEARILENSKDVVLSGEELEAIESILASFSVKGDRYDEHGMAHTEG